MKDGCGNALVGQSGGPTAAINATLSGVIRGTLTDGNGRIGTLYGMRHGIQGLLDDNMIDLTARFPGGEGLTALEDTPAAALGSCRMKLPDPDKDPALYERIMHTLRAHDIRRVFYIGGNDSMDTVAKLNAYTSAHDYPLSVMGIPKTIDNDLIGTDHTPGYGSAAKYIATTVSEILCDCAVYAVPAVTIVEIMGRDAGWLTAAAALPRAISGRGPALVYLPERVFSLPAFLSDVREALAERPDVVVAVSEGVRDETGHYVGEGMQNGVADVFGHRYLAGTAKVLESAVKAQIGCKVRAIELNTPQRCAAHLASATDIEESVRIGAEAVRYSLRGVTGHIMTMTRTLTDGRYGITVSSAPVDAIANRIRCVPDAFITPEGNQVTDECFAYMLPLIAGERTPQFKSGIPVHCVL